LFSNFTKYCKIIEEMSCVSREVKLQLFCKDKEAKKAYFSKDRGLKAHVSIKIEGQKIIFS